MQPIMEHFACASEAGERTSGIAIYGKKITGYENSTTAMRLIFLPRNFLASTKPDCYLNPVL